DEAPRVGIEGSELLLYHEKRPRVADGRLDLLPVPDDPRIEQQLLDALARVSRHLAGIEPAERAAIGFTLAQHGRPAQAGLRAFQQQELEVPAVVMDRHAPFPVVILEHQGVALADPRAAFLHDGRLMHDGHDLSVTATVTA